MNDAERPVFATPAGGERDQRKKTCSQVVGRPLNHSELVRARGALSLPLKDGRYRGRTQPVGGWTGGQLDSAFRAGRANAPIQVPKQNPVWLSRSLEAR
jgi:hypothetical protein